MRLVMTPSCVVQSSVLKGGSAFQRGLDRLKTGPQEPPEAQQGQLQYPGQGLGQSQAQIKDGQGTFKSCTGDKVLGVLADKKLNMSHQRAPAALKAKGALCCTMRCGQQDEGSDSTPVW